MSNEPRELPVVAWHYTGRLGSIQAFILEPPPSMRAEPGCRDLIFKSDADAIIAETADQVDAAIDAALNDKPS